MLTAGALVISEIMADPEGADEGLEWFEIYNATSEPIDLEGLTLVYAKVDNRVTAFVVDRDCPGFSTSNHIDATTTFQAGRRGRTISSRMRIVRSPTWVSTTSFQR